MYVQTAIAQGDLRATIDVYPSMANAWDRIRNPLPSPTGHAFATAKIDAEVRAFLAPLLLESATVDRAHHDEGDVLAAACGDVDGDGGNELVLVSAARVAVGRVRGGQFVPERAAAWDAIGPRSPVPMREALAGAAVVHGAVEVGSTSRGGVRLDPDASGLAVGATLVGLPAWGGDGVVCLMPEPSAGAFDGAPVGCDVRRDPRPAMAVPAPRFDAFGAASVRDAFGHERLVVAVREPSGRVRLKAGDVTSTPDALFGAQLAVGDLDQDGQPEIVTSTDLSFAGAPGARPDDAIDIASWTGGGWPRLRLHPRPRPRRTYEFGCTLPRPGGTRSRGVSAGRTRRAHARRRRGQRGMARPRGRAAMIHRRQFVAGAAAVAATLASPPGFARGRTPYGASLVFHVPWPVSSLDPHRVDDALAAFFGDALFDTLYARDDAGAFVPALAAGDPQLEGNALRVPLRPGVRFASGTPLDARAAAAATSRGRALTTPPRGSPRSPPPRPAPDGLGLVFAMRDAHALVRALASPLVAIVAPRFAPEKPEGTGPFRVEAVAGALPLVRNGFAASGPSYLDAIDARRAPDLVTSLRAFESGADDLGWLGSFLHEPRAGALAFDAGAVGWAIVRTGRARRLARRARRRAGPGRRHPARGAGTARRRAVVDERRGRRGHVDGRAGRSLRARRRAVAHRAGSRAGGPAVYAVTRDHAAPGAGSRVRGETRGPHVRPHDRRRPARRS